MAALDQTEAYKQVIDQLVQSCRSGQGQIGPRRAREGIWNRNATEAALADQQAINRLLERLTAEDRETVAHMLEQAFRSGVHETLVVLHSAQLQPFDHGFEGTPFHDFVGRLEGWEWPVGDRPS